MPLLYDAHNHLQDAWFTPHRERILADLAAAGVSACVVNGTSESDWPDVAALFSQHSAFNSQPALLPSFGLHPWDVGNRTPDWQRTLLTHLGLHQSHQPSSPHPSPSTAFIGEIGLDRWILDRARPDDPRLAGLRRAPLDEQIEVFRWQLALAAERNLPASIHCLDAFGPLLDVLRTTPLPARGFLLHAYSGPAEMVPAFAKFGAHFSFNGAFLPNLPLTDICHIMYDKPASPAAAADHCHTLYDIPRRRRRRLELYRQIPADRLLVETDAPAMRLPPSLERFPPLAADEGSPANHPANLAATYAALAELRGTPLETLTAQVAANFHRLFLAPAT